jgi:hypothetical protein
LTSSSILSTTHALGSSHSNLKFRFQRNPGTCAQVDTQGYCLQHWLS